MYINASFDFAPGTTQDDKTQFQNAVNTAVQYFESQFTNVNVTLNVKFAYGEQFAAVNADGVGVTYKPMPNAPSTGSVLLGINHAAWDTSDYATVRNQLLAKSDSLQSSAYKTLPAVSPFAGDTLHVTSAQEKAIGLAPSNTVGGFDGVIGIISNEELAAGGRSADWSTSAPISGTDANGKPIVQYYMIGNIEHELSEVMGRYSFDGTNAFNDGTGDYTIMDLFRFSPSLFGGGPVRATSWFPNWPEYFSIDNGAHASYSWNSASTPALDQNGKPILDQNGNPVLVPSGDLGDWAAGTPADAFNIAEDSGVINPVSAKTSN
jgi:hypothetical protein